MNRVKKIIVNNRFSLMTFGLAYIIMGIAFARFGVFPFGDRQIMIIDNWHQYFPFMTEVHEKLRSGGSLFYSWKIGMGTNFWFLMAYYAMSPVYLLSVLVPSKFLPEFMAFATLFKIALSGAFFTLYLKKVYDKNDLSLLVFGLLYSFSGYLMGYYWNIMWLDSVVMLPILMLGLYRIVHDKKPLLYAVSLGITLITSFYIGYMVAIFVFLYFFKVYFDHYKWDPAVFIKAVLRVLAWSIVGVSLSAIVLLPAFRGLGLAYGAESANPSKFELYYSFVEIFNNLWLGIEPSIRSGLPNIFSGLFGLLMIFVFFTSKKIAIRTKMTTGIVLSVLVLSFNINYLNFFWHGFHFPNEVPYRFAFVFTFVLLTAGYDAFVNLERENFTRLVLVLSGYLLIYENFLKNAETLSRNIVLLNIVFMVFYGITVYMWTQSKWQKKTFLMVLTGLVILESAITANFAVSAAGTTTKVGYPPSGQEVREGIEMLEVRDSGFYRIEMGKWYSTNDPVFYGYKGVSAFSSTINSNTTGIAEALGLSAAPRANRLLYASNTPILNAFFNVRYVLDRGGKVPFPNAAYDEFFIHKGIQVYKNKYPLEVAFRVSDSIESWRGATKDPFSSQNALLKLASDTTTDVFVPIKPASEIFTGAKKVSENQRYVQYELDDLNTEGFARSIFIVPAKGQVYLYSSPSWSDTLQVTVRGVTTDYEMKRSQIIDLGVLETGEQFEVNLDLNTGYNTFYYLEAMLFNVPAFEKAYEKLQTNTMEVLESSDTHIKGRIRFDESGMLFTSIPYDPGWKIKVNGMETEPIELLDGFIGLSLPAGTYELEFEYIPDGFMEALPISLGALILILFWSIRKK